MIKSALQNSTRGTWALAPALALVLAAGVTACGDDENAPDAKATVETTEKEVPMVVKRQSEITAPMAEKRPQEITQHDITRVDNYAWLRDDSWQAVLRDPSLLKEDISDYLKEEVAYYEQSTSHLEDLRETLVAEMRGRTKEDASSVPMRDGPFEYYVRYREGGEYPVYARRTEEGADEEIYFDGDKERGDAKFFDIGGIDISPNHELMAYGTDKVGSEYYDLRIRNLTTGEEFDETIPSTDGGVVWASDSASFFYVERDDNQRPKRVKHHVLGTDPAEDRLVYEEADDAMFIGIGETSSEEYLIVSVGNGVTSESRFLPLSEPMSELIVIAPRVQDQLYDVDHRGDHFYIQTNADDAVDFKIVKAPVTDPGRDNWEDWLPHRPGTYLSYFVPFKDYIIRMERSNAVPRIVVGDYDGNSHEIEFSEGAFSLGLQGWGEFDTNMMRFSYESPSTPEQTYDYNMETRERELRKTQEVPSGHNPDLYVVEMIEAEGRDGAKIPVMVMRLKDTPMDGSAPLMLYGYGSYGAYIPDSFSTSVLSLVDRGVVYALAHIRGGSSKGRQWYLDGKLDKKENTFRDFNDSAHSLIKAGYTSKGNIVAYGGSAGGLLVGAAVNMEPDLYGGVLGAVPFVDVITTISDDTLPLTPPEWDEWGNPITSAEEYGWIAAYSPYDNIQVGASYPPILATGGLTDYRVTYWEPAKWIARLRDEATGGPFMLRMNMAAGHGGSAARFERMEERAHLYAFALDIFGKVDTAPVDHKSN